MALTSNWLEIWLAQDQEGFPWDRRDITDVWQTSLWSPTVAGLDRDDDDDDDDDDDPRPINTAQTDEDSPVSIDVLAPFRGEDDDDEQTIVYRFDAFSENGAEIRLEGDQLVYDPSDVLDFLAVGETLSDRFFYVLAEQEDDDEIDDPFGVWLTVTVTGVNDAPVTQAIMVDVNEDGPAVTAAFLGDDVDSDNSQSSLIYDILSGPSEGDLANNGDASFTFDPDGDFEDLALGESRSVGFTYQATDRHGAVSNVSNGTITVEGANDRPIAENVEATVNEDFLLGVTAAFDASDVDLTDVLSFKITSDPEKGSVINNLDGTFTYTPFDDPNNIDTDPNTPDNRFQYLNDGESEQVTFSYVAIDDSGADNKTSEERTVTITVTGLDDDPLTFTEQLAFLSEDQSIWGPDSAFQFQSLEFFGGSWNESVSPTLLNAVTLIEETELCIPFTNICTTIPEVGIPALGVNASTSGTVGLLSDFQIDSGSIDTNLFVDAGVTVPFQVAEGRNATVDTQAFLDAMSDFSITTPFISYDLNLIFNVAADLGVWSGNSSNSVSLLGGGLSFANAPGFNPNNPTSGAGTSLLSFSTNDASFDLPDIIEGLVTATVNIPNLDTTGSVNPPPSNVVESFAEDDFFIVGFDIDGIATRLIPALPDLEAEVDVVEIGPFSGTAGYNLLDLTLETSLTVTQAFELTAEDFLFDIQRADTGETVASDVSAGDSFNFMVPTGVGDTLSFTATVDPVATLNNQTGLGFDVDFVIDALSASLGLSVAGIELVELTAGPVFSDSIDIFNTGLGTFFDEEFTLAGFEEKTFGFDIFVA